MSPQAAGGWLVVASVAFFMSWVLMPGVGVTDTARIFELVGANRSSVFASVVLQLVSAAAYAPGLAGLLAMDDVRRARGAKLGVVLLLVGAMGSAADAIFHLVAYEMTAPGLPLEAMATVMKRLQGPDLALLLPFVVAFFAGHVVLLRALRGLVPHAKLGFRVLVLIPLVIVVGGPLAKLGFVPARLVGLSVLGTLSASLAIVGFGAWRSQPR